MNARIQEALDKVNTSVEPTVDTLDEVVYPVNALSTKLIKLQAKIIAIDDAMNVFKKHYEKDNIDLQEFLKNIRALANKQCKTTIKVNRLLASMQ
mmetsp:Transcript_18010/g.12953  ORF Transcript_18010/g.12953 Transcript_18010/m.12953 type:complete len:95 (+) Transcript_18010:796-1080(+)|eukprot:CAMPEP_0116874248 /NCGR_PEP_ID=MMETSP0463-20121206/5684_1 /TAXON_ID=181622 /ORGANISM="Strombidinopsis sp, Strain SopsisLIS2011" /LENGTH=94 /DNA_ID=CAMNT_0004517651 /DNA_START=796 /DNA_END=1083 /DNA_ORIENTATION=-